MSPLLSYKEAKCISSRFWQLLTINQQWKPVEELELVKKLSK